MLGPLAVEVEVVVSEHGHVAVVEVDGLGPADGDRRKSVDHVQDPPYELAGLFLVVGEGRVELCGAVQAVSLRDNDGVLDEIHGHVDGIFLVEGLFAEQDHALQKTDFVFLVPAVVERLCALVEDVGSEVGGAVGAREPGIGRELDSDAEHGLQQENGARVLAVIAHELCTVHEGHQRVDVMEVELYEFVADFFGG